MKHRLQVVLSRILGLKATPILLVLAFYICVISPQLHAFPTIARRVRFTGVLLRVKDPGLQKGLLEDLNVMIGKERWTLLIDTMEIVGGVGLNRATLQQLFPPLVRFFGPDDLIRRLKNPETAGNVLTIAGLLYTGSRTLFLICVDESEETGAVSTARRIPIKSERRFC